ncbi:uncharacterized protein C8R40DRAFT_1166609 [Lentinula edodes]|uniref:uncharacterized protein n=1 Tax=Lentinula edodes TaxID=5353 RepID=UPI001E8D0D4D|nr:uncharacterized protein C8R40DRAFT_1166609 [Lentinula edodes]KAH7879368.1 hypothetical protein C8R40DRAFT_1166609 [Lentinula edodes]
MTWVDEIRPQFILEPSQVREIKGMVMLAQGVDMELLKLHLLTHAAICRMENKNCANNSESSAVKEVVDVAMKQLSKHVEIPGDIKLILRTIAREECANPARGSYCEVGNAVWRCFMREFECKVQGPVFKRRKTNNGGCQAQDDAFWGRFDKFLKEKIDAYGQNMKEDRWKAYLTETVQADWELFGKPSNTLLPALPFVVSSTEPTTGRAPLTEVPNRNNRASGAVGNGSEIHEEEYTYF